MAVYPCHRSVLVVKPTKISSSDLEELKSEINKNPMLVLDWLVDNRCSLQEDTSIPFEQTDFGGFYSEEKKAFIFYNCLLNTADVAKKLGFDPKNGPSRVVELVDRGAFTSIRSKNGQFRVIVADGKYNNFASNFSKEGEEVPMGSKEVKGRGLTTQIVFAIQDGLFASPIIDVQDVENALKRLDPPWIRDRDYNPTSISSSLEALQRKKRIDKTDRRGKWKIRNYTKGANVVSEAPAPVAIPTIMEAPVTKAMTGHSVSEQKRIIDRIMSSDLDKETKMKIIEMTLS